MKCCLLILQIILNFSDDGMAYIIVLSIIIVAVYTVTIKVVNFPTVKESMVPILPSLLQCISNSSLPCSTLVEVCYCI